MMYDSAVDDVVVALLAVWTLVEKGRWDLLAELGLDKEVCAGFTCKRPTSLHAEGADDALGQFVALHPSVLGAALESLRRYRAAFGVE